MRNAICLAAFLVLGTVCQAADPPVETGENRDTLLYVKTDPPGAKVFLGDKELGSSNDTFPVEPGVGTIRVELEGHKPGTKQITIQGNRITRVDLKLMPRSDGNVKKLIAKLSDPKEPRFKALNDIVFLGKDAVPPLIDAMKTNKNWQIPKALGAIGDKRAVEPLIDKLAKEQWSPMREVVVEALQIITKKDFGADAEQWRTWWKEEGKDGHDEQASADLTATGGPASTSKGGDAAQLAQQGWQLWQERKLDEATAKFEAALRLAPKNEAALNGLGWASFNSGKFAKAQKVFEQLVAINPDHPAALNGLGQLHLAQKEYELAEKYLLKAAPKAPAAWYGLTRLYLLQGKFEQAEKYAQMLVDSGQSDESANRMLKAAKERSLPEGLRVVIEPQPMRSEPTTSAEAALEDKDVDKSSAVDAGSRSPVGENILKNSGVEAGGEAPEAWEQGAAIDGVAYSWDKAAAFEGKASLRIEKTANRYFPIAQWSQTVDRTGSSSALAVSAQVKAEKMTKAILDVIFLDKDGQWISHQWASYIGSKKNGQPPANHDWKKYAGSVKIPPKTAKITIALQVYGPGKVWFDDVQARYGTPVVPGGNGGMVGKATEEEAAVKSAEAWLALVDQEKYEASWDAAAEGFRNVVSKDSFVKSLKGVRSPLGAMKARELSSKQFLTKLPGAPDGQYVVIQFKTSFANKESAVETITPMLDKDGTWRVSGYYIK